MRGAEGRGFQSDDGAGKTGAEDVVKSRFGAGGRNALSPVGVLVGVRVPLLHRGPG